MVPTYHARGSRKRVLDGTKRIGYTTPMPLLLRL
jgi:hypothetical protein